MAEEDDPFTPRRGGDPTMGLPDFDTFNRLANQWTSFLSDPSAQTALLSAGLALMQPPSFGDTPVSQIGRAIGAAGEAVTRREALDIKEQEALSRMGLREAQAEAATSRAGTAGAMADVARERLGLEQQKIDISREDVDSKIAYREAQGQAQGIRAEAARARAQAATQADANAKQTLELRARQLDMQANDLESRAKARMDRASAAHEAIASRERTAKGTREIAASNAYARYRKELAERNQQNELFQRPAERELSFDEFAEQHGYGTAIRGGTTTAPAPTTPARALPQGMTQKDFDEAKAWLRANPNHPKAPDVRRLLGE